MACPGCGCKVTYQYNCLDTDFISEGEEYERCAACGFIFDAEFAANDDEQSIEGE